MNDQKAITVFMYSVQQLFQQLSQSNNFKNQKHVVLFIFVYGEILSIQTLYMYYRK